MRRVSNSVKVEEWTDRLLRFQDSNLTVARFCHDEGVSVPSFYKWKRKLRVPQSMADSDLPATNQNHQRQNAFQAVQVLRSNENNCAPSVVTVCVPGGIQVHIADCVPAIQAVVREVIHTVKHADNGADAC